MPRISASIGGDGAVAAFQGTEQALDMRVVIQRQGSPDAPAVVFIGGTGGWRGTSATIGLRSPFLVSNEIRDLVSRQVDVAKVVQRSLPYRRDNGAGINVDFQVEINSNFFAAKF